MRQQRSHHAQTGGGEDGCDDDKDDYDDEDDDDDGDDDDDYDDVSGGDPGVRRPHHGLVRATQGE